MPEQAFDKGPGPYVVINGQRVRKAAASVPAPGTDAPPPAPAPDEPNTPE